MASREQAEEQDSFLLVCSVAGFLSILDRCLPWSARAGFIVLKHTLDGFNFLSTPSTVPYLRPALTGVDILCTASVILLAPAWSTMLVDFIIRQPFTRYSMTTLTCWIKDGPDANLTLTRERQNSQLFKIVWFSVLVSQPVWCLQVVLHLATWVVAPAVCFALLLYPVERLIIGSKVLIYPVYPRLLQLLYWIWDIYQVLPSLLTRALPHTIQVKSSRFQQNRRKREQLPSYVYGPIASNEIRLLVLERATTIPPGCIRASLIPVLVDYAGEYEAISYCWGSSARTEEIILDDARFAITRSALDVLIARRPLGKSRKIWIDAICINQADDAEKSVQIGYMRDIYRQATTTVAFPSNDYRLRLLEPVLTHLTCPTTSPPFDRPMNWYLPPASETSPLQLRILAYFFSLSYFRRAWVFQEVAVSSKINVYLGGRYVTWETLWKVVDRLTPTELDKLFYGFRPRLDTAETQTSVSVRRGVRNIQMMSLYRQMCEEGRHVASNRGVFAAMNQTELGLGVSSAGDLELGLVCTQRFLATDSRDRVYALLGVVREDYQHSLLQPDYKKTEERVFLDTTQYLLFHSKPRSINILALAGIGHSRRNRFSHSWVPDFTHERPYNVLTYSDWPGLGFSAAIVKPAYITRGALPGSLSVVGVVIDKIVSVSAVCLPKLSDLESDKCDRPAALDVEVDHIVQFLDGLIALINRHKDRWPNLRTEVWQALISGGHHESITHPELLPEAFELLLSSKGILASSDWKAYKPFLEQLEAAHGRDKLIKLMKCMDAYSKVLQHVCEGRAFAITESGEMCLCPPLVAAEDTVFIAYGARLPFLLRRGEHHRDDTTYEHLGEVYLRESERSEYLISQTRPFSALIV